MGEGIVELACSWESFRNANDCHIKRGEREREIETGGGERGAEREGPVHAGVHAVPLKALAIGSC